MPTGKQSNERTVVVTASTQVLSRLAGTEGGVNFAFDETLAARLERDSDVCRPVVRSNLGFHSLRHLRSITEEFTTHLLERMPVCLEKKRDCLRKKVLPSAANPIPG